MIFKTFFSGVLLLWSIAVLAQNKINNTMENKLGADQSEVLKTVRQLADWMIRKDTVAMNMILDKDYSLTHMTGYIQPKTEWFGEVEKESMKYYSAKEVNYKISIHENKAEVIMQNLVDARIWGTRNIWRLQQKMQLEKQKGRWIILKSVASTF